MRAHAITATLTNTSSHATALTNLVIYLFICISLHVKRLPYTYGVATISRLLKMIGLFCRISSFL